MADASAGSREKDGTAKNSPAGDGGGAARPGPQRRVELVEPASPDDGHNARIGLALLASLVIGFGPLRDAALGNGSFPQAVGRYLLCLGACVAAMLVLGRLLDGAPPPEDDEPEVASESDIGPHSSTDWDPPTK